MIPILLQLQQYSQQVSFSSDPILFLEQNPVMFSLMLFGIVLLILLTALYDQRKQNREHIKRNEQLAKMVSALRKRVIQIQQISIDESRRSTDAINELKSQRAEAILEKERAEAEKVNLHTQLNQTQSQMNEMRSTFNRRINRVRKMNDSYLELQKKYEKQKDICRATTDKLRDFMLDAVYDRLDKEAIKKELRLE